MLQLRGAVPLNGKALQHFNITEHDADKNQLTFKAE
jgi:hypothetical protein